MSGAAASASDVGLVNNNTTCQHDENGPPNNASPRRDRSPRKREGVALPSHAPPFDVLRLNITRRRRYVGHFTTIMTGDVDSLTAGDVDGG
jgi:hypothetical protein